MAMKIQMGILLKHFYQYIGISSFCLKEHFGSKIAIKSDPYKTSNGKEKCITKKWRKSNYYLIDWGKLWLKYVSFMKMMKFDIYL